jgi:hypothetical protein
MISDKVKGVLKASYDAMSQTAEGRAEQSKADAAE